MMDTAGDRDVMDTAGDVTRTGKRTGDATDGGRDGRGPASGGREGGTCAAPESVPVTSLGPSQTGAREGDMPSAAAGGRGGGGTFGGGGGMLLEATGALSTKGADFGLAAAAPSHPATPPPKKKMQKKTQSPAPTGDGERRAGPRKESVSVASRARIFSWPGADGRRRAPRACRRLGRPDRAGMPSAPLGNDGGREGRETAQRRRPVAVGASVSLRGPGRAPLAAYSGLSAELTSNQLSLETGAASWSWPSPAGRIFYTARTETETETGTELLDSVHCL